MTTFIKNDVTRNGVVPELGEYIIAQNSKLVNQSADELNRLLTSIKLAAKLVNREVSQAGLVDILGSVGTENVQGETQQKLDVFANEKFMNSLKNREVVCGICSEEEEHFIPVNDDCRYVICMDPLDGSSNIDVNVSVGTIFSIYHRTSPVGTKVTTEDFLQPGKNQIAAGYVLYGSCTQLVLSTGNGVQCFTLDLSLGTFFLSHSKIRIPEEGEIYSINGGNWESFPLGVKNFIAWCQDNDEATNRPYTMRYIGSLVSDFHRNMLFGGIYMYPPTEKHKKGKLRLLYECNCMAFLAEQAGGCATNGFQRILDIQPTELHERTAIFVGSKKLVEKANECMMAYSKELQL